MSGSHAGFVTGSTALSLMTSIDPNAALGSHAGFVTGSTAELAKWEQSPFY